MFNVVNDCPPGDVPATSCECFTVKAMDSDGCRHVALECVRYTNCTWFFITDAEAAEGGALQPSPTSAVGAAFVSVPSRFDGGASTTQLFEPPVALPGVAKGATVRAGEQAPAASDSPQHAAADAIASRIARGATGPIVVACGLAISGSPAPSDPAVVMECVKRARAMLAV